MSFSFAQDRPLFEEHFTFLQSSTSRTVHFRPDILRIRNEPGSNFNHSDAFSEFQPGNGMNFYLTHVLFSSNSIFEILTLLSYVRNCFRWGDLIVPSSPGVARRRTLKRLISRCVYKFEMREYFNWINMHLGHVTRIPIYFIGL